MDINMKLSFTFVIVLVLSHGSNAMQQQRQSFVRVHADARVHAEISGQALISIEAVSGQATETCSTTESRADGTPIVHDSPYFFKDRVAKSGSLVDKADGWFDFGLKSSAFPIDFVYCWAGEAVQHDGEGMQETSFGSLSNHNRGEGFGEIRWSLKYLEANAPWFNKVYILVDSPAKRPKWLSADSSGKIEMVDRCTLLGKNNCPTKNSQACQSVMHKIPNLSEHFVAMQDDMVIINPTQPSDFFADDGKPLVLAKGAEKDHDMYDRMLSGPDQPPESRPTRMSDFRHIPTPLLVSFAKKLEQTYPEWYRFVGSHHTRFICCDAGTSGDGLDEDFLRVYPHMLYKENVGMMGAASHHQNCVTNPCDEGRDRHGECYSSHLDDKSNKFMVLQSISSIDTWKKVEAAMSKHLPAQSQLVVG